MGRVEESQIPGVFLVVSDHILSFKAIKIFWSIWKILFLLKHIKVLILHLLISLITLEDRALQRRTFVQSSKCLWPVYLYVYFGWFYQLYYCLLSVYLEYWGSWITRKALSDRIWKSELSRKYMWELKLSS